MISVLVCSTASSAEGRRIPASSSRLILANDGIPSALTDLSAHEHRQSDFMLQLEDVLYSGNPNQIPMGATGNTSNIDSYLDILRRASFASKGDERQVTPSATAMRINLHKVEYCMCMVNESVSLDNSTVRDKHEDYGWRNGGEGVCVGSLGYNQWT